MKVLTKAIYSILFQKIDLYKKTIELRLKIELQNVRVIRFLTTQNLKESEEKETGYHEKVN